jgi:phosphoribosylglycinamide formyltransferase 1
VVSAPEPIVVLASGAGSLLDALLRASDDPRYGARVAAVVTDRADTGAQSLANTRGIPTHVLRLEDHETRESWDEHLTATVAAYEPTLVISAGFLKLVGAGFLHRFGGRYLNSHNALLPSFPGIHGPADALAYGVKVSGATLFVVDAGVDTGVIVAQTVVPVDDCDTVATLTERIKAAERPQLVEHVGRMVREGCSIAGRTCTIGPAETV